MGESEKLRIEVSERAGSVSALLLRPPSAHCLLALAHGAGVGMEHPSMHAIADGLAHRGIATLRYQFPYTEQGRRSISPRGQLLATVRAAVACAARRAEGLPLFAGGKSMGGRMTSMAQAETPLPDVRGIVFFGFPLHAAGKPSDERGAHLFDVDLPMLFLQGTRDKLAELDLLRPICRKLGRRATLLPLEGADHSFHVLKRSGRTDAEVMDELCAGAEEFTHATARGPE